MVAHQPILYTSNIFSQGIKSAGHQLMNDTFFDTLTITPKEGIDAIRVKAEQYEINLRYRDKEHVRHNFITKAVA